MFGLGKYISKKATREQWSGFFAYMTASSQKNVDKSDRNLNCFNS